MVDATAFAHRAFWAHNPTYRESDGFPTWAILGFMSMLWRILGAAEADKPTYGVAVFDAPGVTFRHNLYPPYKAHRVRDGRVEELAPQLPLMREAARTLGLQTMERAGFEADDVIATLAHKAKSRGIRTTIVSSDKDFCQLVQDGVVEIVDPMSRKRVLQADVERRFLVEPKRVADVQALAGDDVDGYRGIKGVGIKHAAALLNLFGSLDGVLHAARNKREYMAAKTRSEILKVGDDLHVFKKLATLRRNVPITVEFEKLRTEPVLKTHIVEICRALEASARVEALFSLDPKLARSAAPDPRPLDWWEEELKAPGQRIPETPQCGFYQRRLVKGGVFVPCRIWREPELDANTGQLTGMELILCTVGDWRRDPLAEWPRLAMAPIPDIEYRHLMRVHAWAKVHDPKSPEANPRKPAITVDMEPPTFTKTSKKASKSR